MIVIYGIKNCDSVKKAIKYMKNHHLTYQFIDLKEESLSAEKIRYWASKIEIKKLFNTRGTTYRNLKLKELHLDDTTKERWLVKEPMLLKRPIIEYKDDVIVAYDEPHYDTVFRVKRG
jgi:Spx/MgsR family transcriptional regulator